ncbi:hypothetical protein [Amycolatopsis aidingensis]|uniref:hypothetical protein n=1 Tax=Amycolatopsis aidingensis TaxID=2842453 RepID=UPI001E2BCFC0|nr:hypothetical protein [Amycolatopsis aidingensis]
MSTKESMRARLGISPWLAGGLAVLGVPRVIAHDLGLVGPVLNAVLVFLPIAIWAAVVLWQRVPNPLRTLTAVGLVYGVLLAVTHQLLWTEAFGDSPPSLGGNLAGVLAPAAEGVLLRVFAFGSSLVTGLAVGAATGAVCWVLARLVPGFRPQ